MILVLFLFVVAASLGLSVLFVRALGRQKRRLERIGRRLASLELEAGATVAVEPTSDHPHPRPRTQLLN